MEWPRSAAPIEVQSTWLRETLRVGPLALSGAPAPEMTHTAFLVRESGELYRAGLPAAGPRAVATLVETRLPGGAVAVAAGSGDDAYFVLRSGPAQWSLFAMQRVPDR